MSGTFTLRYLRANGSQVGLLRLFLNKSFHALSGGN